MPLTVKLSAKRCNPYPRKKLKAKTGKNKTKNKTITNKKVKLCIIPLCLMKNCKILNVFFFPRVENLESMSGINVARKATKINDNLYSTLEIKTKIKNKVIDRCVRISMVNLVKN